ncbi:MAG: PHP-associated domain-containing protein [Dehalococcoidia bacterium]|nr:PHP-associated domain-containing protein [Dehalococcoidia bacterium]
MRDERRAKRGEDDLGRADLHIHSGMGDGLAPIPQLLDYVEHETDLDVIAITDHDSLTGGLKAKEMAAQKGYSFQVIAGTEVTTLEGHLLALFLERPVPSLRSLRRTIEAIHAQGGICVVPHPMSWLTRSVGRRSLERIMASTEDDIYLDGLEVINPMAGRVTFKKVKHLNQTIYGLAETGGSDAHFLRQIGGGCTTFPGRTAEDLRQALADRATAGVLAFTMRLRELGADEVLAQQWRSLVVLPSKHVSNFVRKIVMGQS